MCFASLINSLCGSSAWGGGQASFLSNFNSFKNSCFSLNSFSNWCPPGGGIRHGGGFGNYGHHARSGGYTANRQCHNQGSFGGGHYGNYRHQGHYGGGHAKGWSNFCPPTSFTPPFRVPKPAVPTCPPKPQVSTCPPKPQVFTCLPKPQVSTCPPKPQLSTCPSKSEGTPSEPTAQPKPMDPIRFAQAYVWGAGHTIGADGDIYRAEGEAGKTYNLFSDKGVQVNARFWPWSKNTSYNIIYEAGVTTKNADGSITKVHFDKDGKLTVDGERITADGTYGNVTKKGNDVTITSGEYEIKLRAWDGFVSVYFKSENAVSDNVEPHGLLGVTVDADNNSRDGDIHHKNGQKGGSALEKADGTIIAKHDTTTIKEYEVSRLFDTQFESYTNKFNG